MRGQGSLWFRARGNGLEAQIHAALLVGLWANEALVYNEDSLALSS